MQKLPHRVLVRILPAALLVNLVLAPNAEASPAVGPDAATHVVQPGETLSTIAADTDTDVQTLMALNGLTNPDQVLVGQVLTLSAPAAAPAAPPTMRTHVVAVGETLAGIAAAEGVDANALAGANGITDPNLLLIGMTLVVPGPGTAPSSQAESTSGAAQDASEPPASAAIEPALPTAPPLTAPSQPVTHPYVVQQGDTLGSIAAQTGVGVNTLLADNTLVDPNLLLPGTTIQIPAGTREHVVANGETLEDIAAEEKIDVATLIQLNGIADPNLVVSGQVLQLPGQRQPVVAAAAPAPEPAANEAAASDASTNASAASDASTNTSAAPELVANDAASSQSQSDATPQQTPTPPPSPTPAPQSQSNGGKQSSKSKKAKSATPSPTPSPSPTPAVSVKAVHGDLAATAMSLLGAPYVWGGDSPSGFDCSGFIWYVAEQAGMPIGRQMQDEYDAGSHPNQNKLKRGDLVFFQDTYTSGLSHNGIYLGNGQFIHAADEEDGVTISNLDDDYWTAHWYGATRLRSN